MIWFFLHFKNVYCSIEIFKEIMRTNYHYLARNFFMILKFHTHIYLSMTYKINSILNIFVAWCHFQYRISWVLRKIIFMFWTKELKPFFYFRCDRQLISLLWWFLTLSCLHVSCLRAISIHHWCYSQTIFFSQVKLLSSSTFYLKTKTMKKTLWSQRKKEKWFTSKILNIIIIVLFFEVLGGLSAKFYYCEMTDYK